MFLLHTNTFHTEFISQRWFRDAEGVAGGARPAGGAVLQQRVLGRTFGKSYSRKKWRRFRIKANTFRSVLPQHATPERESGLKAGEPDFFNCGWSENYAPEEQFGSRLKTIPTFLPVKKRNPSVQLQTETPKDLKSKIFYFPLEHETSGL